jgi:hypothetical protein
MIHYHGIAGFSNHQLVKFLPVRHVLISFAYKEHLEAAAEFASSFVLDNGAFTIWKKGGKLDIDGYINWCYQWHKHPSFDWCIIPDKIEGCEKENNELIADFPKDINGVPVWHFYESLEKLKWLTETYQKICIAPNGGPNNIYSKLGTTHFWSRIAQAMNILCDAEGKPKVKIHGLRLLNPELFRHIPLSSADSTNAVQNRNTADRFGMYKPASESQRAIVIADRIEQYNSSPVWVNPPEQMLLFG